MAGGVQGRRTLGRGLAATRVAMGGRGEFQQVRSEPMEKGAGLAWDGGQHDPSVPCSSQPQYVRFLFLPGMLLTPPKVSLLTPLVHSQSWASWGDHTPHPSQLRAWGFLAPGDPGTRQALPSSTGDVTQSFPEDLDPSCATPT